MQQRRQSRNKVVATHSRTISLDEKHEQDPLDRKMLEALERIERLRTKARVAAGILAGQQ